MCVNGLSFWKSPKDWQTGMIIPTHKKGDRRECTN